MYHLCLYGLMAAPPTKAHQAIIHQLLANHLQQTYTLAYTPAPNGQCIVTVQNSLNKTIFNDTLVSLGLPPSLSHTEPSVRDRLVKRALSKQHFIDYTEICCMLSADGPPVLGKLSSAPSHHRFEMLKLAANEVDDPDAPRVIVSDLEIELSQWIELPSYTANTLTVLRKGLNELMKHDDHLLSISEQTNLSLSDKNEHLNRRKEKITAYLQNPAHEWLTADGFLPDDQCRISLVMGLDSFNSLHKGTWFHSIDIYNYADAIYVIDRKGSDLSIVHAHREKHCPVFLMKLMGAEDMSDYSSTACRHQIEMGKINVGQFISPSVQDYVDRHQLFSTLPIIKT